MKSWIKVRTRLVARMVVFWFCAAFCGFTIAKFIDYRKDQDAYQKELSLNSQMFDNLEECPKANCR